MEEDRHEAVGNPSADMINWRKVESSNVEAVGWPRHTGTTGIMFVKFKGGGLYAYWGVSRQRVVACARSKSVGKYINSIIKPQFDAVKVV